MKMTRVPSSSVTRDRRTFLKHAAALAALGCAARSTATTPRYRMGLQLYTVREPMAKDPVGTLEQAAAMGYRNFETYGFEPGTAKYYGMPAREFREVLDDLGLTTTTGHYDLHEYLARPAADMPPLAGLEEYFVEQGDNFAESPMKSIEVSAQYVRRRFA